MRRAVYIVSIIPLVLFSNPKGCKVVTGACRIEEMGKEMRVSVSDRTILNWKGFSIDKGEITTFIQPTASSVVLNRVISKDVSQIQGKLNANGHVVLINPNGVVVTKSGIVNTASFIASSLDIHDRLFIENQTLEFFGDNKKGVINYGTIEAFDGDIVLMGFSVQDHGTIRAKNGQVHLLASEKVFIKPTKTKRVYIQAQGLDKYGLEQDGNPYKEAFSCLKEEDALNVLQKEGQSFLVSSAVVTGTISSNSSNKDGGGKVVIAGDYTVVDKNASIDVSSQFGSSQAGTILIGGGFQGEESSISNSKLTVVGTDVQLLARAGQEGNGGLVVLWSDGKTLFDGLIDVRGGEDYGDGGIVEISGKEGFSSSGKTLRTAKNGIGGKLYWDPDADVIIHHDSKYQGAFKQGVWNPLGSESYIEIGTKTIPGTLLYELQQGDVIVQTHGKGFEGSEGNIIFKDDVVYHLLPGNNLTLKSGGDIVIKGKLTNTGPGDIIIDSCHNLILDAGLSKKDVVLGVFEGDLHIRKVFNDLVVKGGENNCAILGYHTSRNPILGNVYIDEVGNDFILQGGRTEEGFALVGSYMAPSIYTSIEINKIGNNLRLEPNEGFCQIGNVQTSDLGFLRGDIYISEVKGDLDLLSSLGKAHIGHGSLGSYTYEQEGNISIEKVGGSVNLFSSKNFSQIGHANQKKENANKIGNITLCTAGNINLSPGTEKDAYALIGHGGVGGSFDHGLLQGNFSLSTKGEIYIGGNLGNTFATVGFALADVTTKNPIRIFSNRFTVFADQDITLRSGSSSDSVIGGYLPLRSDQLSLGVKNLEVNTNKFIFIEGYDGLDYHAQNYSEAVIGLRGKNSVSIHEYKGKMGLSIHGEEGIVVQGSVMSSALHPAYIRGINRNTYSVISSYGDVSFYAEGRGEAALIHDGPLRVISKEGKIEFLSTEFIEAYAEVFGNRFEMIAKNEILLKDANSYTGKIYIHKGKDKNSPIVYHDGTIYKENEDIEDALELITLSQTDPIENQERDKIGKVKVSDDLVSIDSLPIKTKATLAIFCNGGSFDNYYHDATAQSLYQANILTSEFLYRITPLMECLGYKESFFLSGSRLNDPYFLNKRPFFIRRPYVLIKGRDQDPFYW